MVTCWCGPFTASMSRCCHCGGQARTIRNPNNPGVHALTSPVQPVNNPQSTERRNETKTEQYATKGDNKSLALTKRRHIVPASECSEGCPATFGLSARMARSNTFVVSLLLCFSSITSGRAQPAFSSPTLQFPHILAPGSVILPSLSRYRFLVLGHCARTP